MYMTDVCMESRRLYKSIKLFSEFSTYTYGHMGYQHLGNIKL